MNYQFGVDYYPEHWPEARWRVDAALMREMGLKVVRLAEFAWTKLEPQSGLYDFGWLDRAIGVLSEHGLSVVLGTPTACPPAWLIQAHPEILPTDSQGRVRGFGGRHHDCQSNSDYRRHVERIVVAMGKRYGKDPRVVGWQIDNELGNSHEDLCHCSSCAAAFRHWLAARYGSIDILNSRWGTVFWSQTYSSFNQVPTPMLTPNSHSPSLLLDWKRFHSDLIVEFHDFQVKLLRQFATGLGSSGQFITHNLMGLADGVDYFQLGQQLDFVSHDQYPHGFWETQKTPSALAGTLALMRGIKRQSFWIMEQQSGPTGWETLAPTPRPGQLALWAAQSVAHGADTVVFFRWRTCTVGTEQYWHGILPHDGIPGRRHAELKALIAELAPVMGRFEGASPDSEVGILYSYEQNWALEVQPHHPELDYVSAVQELYQGFWDKNVPVDFVGPDAELSGYKLLVAPFLFLESPGLSKRLGAYVEAGGHLLVTFRSGIKNLDNVCLSDGPPPGPFATLLGLEVLDYDCLREGPTSGGRYWWDVVTPTRARCLILGGEGGHAGEPMLTNNPVGRGSASYLATLPEAEKLGEVVDQMLALSAIKAIGESPRGVELVRRRTASQDYLFVLNHENRRADFHPDGSWNLVAGKAGPLQAYEWSVYATQPLERESSSKD